jgi:hypothetical protein
MEKRKETKQRHSTLTSHDPQTGEVGPEAPTDVFHLQQIFITNIGN